MTEPTAAPLPLPGMEDLADRTAPYLEVGVRRTIARLVDLGYVDEMHAAHTAAAIELSQIIDAKKSSGKMSTVGNDMRAMIELLDRLVPEREDDDTNKLIRKTLDEWIRETQS